MITSIKKNYWLALSCLLIMPATSADAQVLDLTDSKNLLKNIKTLVNDTIPLLIAVALVFFIYALLSFMLQAGEKRDEARNQMVYGIIILAVIVGVWGLVNFVLGAFNISAGGTPTAIPGV